MIKGAVAFGIVLVSAVGLTAPPDPTIEYAFAQKCYHSLDKTGDKGWNKCLRKFNAVVRDYPKSDIAPKALFSVGRLYQEKFGISHDPEDLQKSLEAFNALLKKYPKNSLADDALYRIGVLRFEKQKDREKAEKAMKALVERYPEGDMQPLAAKYLQKLEAGPQGPAALAPPVISIRPKGEDEDPSTGSGRTGREKPIEEENPQEKKEMSPPESKIDFSIKTVVIDPGHGGEDPGAIGPDGSKEAVVALQIARKLSFKLKNDLKLKVHLTRTTNKNLSLEERNRIANKLGADLFISIHANASESPKLSGVQTFYLNNATSKAASKLADRENKSAGKRRDLSQNILSTMLQNANTEDSRVMAREVHNALVKHLRRKEGSTRDLKVDSALFYVLVGAKSPGILVETSFISNPKEEKRLKDAGFQWSVAEGIAQGVKNYINSRGKMASSL
ncbi:MAG: N-acetylmuramoyl-L-alanine amidase [Deltaproteobacteria bacterium]|nr:N-acetylmuramoyl-L-alanine amidase [Deltaproteobacteria bacterium]